MSSVRGAWKCYRINFSRKKADLILQELLLPVTLACAHDYVSVCLMQANAATKDKPGVPFGVCSCIASGFKAWTGAVKMKELKNNNNKIILVIENLHIKEILIRHLEFSGKCKRKGNPEVLKFPEPHGHLSWTLVSLLGHQWGYSVGLCSNCLSNDLFTWESIKAALEKEVLGSLSFPWASPCEASWWRRKKPILHSNYTL